MQYSKVGDEEFLEGNYTSMNTRDSSSCGRGTVFLRKVVTSDFYKEPFLVEKEKAKEKPKIAEKKPEVIVKKTTPATNPPATKSNTTKPKTTPNNTAKKPIEKPAIKDAASKVVMAPADTPKRAVVKVPDPVNTPKILLSRENELVKTIATSAPEVVVNLYDNGTIDNDTISVYLDKKLVLQKKRLTAQPLTLRFKLDENTDYHELVMVAENLGEIPPNTSLMVVNAGKQQYEVRITSTEQKNAVVIFKYQR